MLTDPDGNELPAARLRVRFSSAEYRGDYELAEYVASDGSAIKREVVDEQRVNEDSLPYARLQDLMVSSNRCFSTASQICTKIFRV